MKQKITGTLKTCYSLLRLFAIPIIVILLFSHCMSLRQAGEPKHIDKNER